MTTLKALAVIALWDTGRFDTAEIAHATGTFEADVARILHLTREERRART
jgi:hypothetical protein